ncbi:sensor histidine kinase KdpD [Mangrovimonas sp. TPBH4]|uniref:sensor histidine kinase n=1 Tax=Mangrovimonas sp. TPBH4 TaxID=1645914 RepID=UPI0006B4BDBF|nr:HAMP domain-containing sensor histidine kinase [Mangrovimonas sp. TPBH4]
MNDKRYNWILYIIVLVILCTIGIQVYWNYKNYLSNKQQLINEVQISLDNAVDAYYTELAENTTIGFAFSGEGKDAFMKDGGAFDSIIKQIDFSTKQHKGLDSLELKSMDGISIFKGKAADSMLSSLNLHKPKMIDHVAESAFNNDVDSSKRKTFEILTSKVVISLSSDSISLPRIDTLFQKELLRKRIDIDYKLTENIKDNDTITVNQLSFTPKNQKLKKLPVLSTTSESSYLPRGNNLTVYFANETAEILQRSLSGILISTVLVLAVISCLFYLLKIIKHQKQLSEVKNDLISNITHEFKTPIATISAAIEGIKNFNTQNDPKKTETYLNISNQQLSKLNTMVEKLLETATLDSENLPLNKETGNITELLQTVINKHKLQLENKTLVFHPPQEQILAKVDVFHFENALNNILDNAIKYGGPQIEVLLNQDHNTFNIEISDSGKTITAAHKEQIFEKFYRIPKGNTHDVKGFGIGLYYTKKIIEKHSGSIQLDLTKDWTTFKINMPNDS